MPMFDPVLAKSLDVHHSSKCFLRQVSPAFIIYYHLYTVQWVIIYVYIYIYLSLSLQRCIGSIAPLKSLHPKSSEESVEAAMVNLIVGCLAAGRRLGRFLAEVVGVCFEVRVAWRQMEVGGWRSGLCSGKCGWKMMKTVANEKRCWLETRKKETGIRLGGFKH